MATGLKRVPWWELERAKNEEAMEELRQELSPRSHPNANNTKYRCQNRAQPGRHGMKCDRIIGHEGPHANWYTSNGRFRWPTYSWLNDVEEGR